ncbi:DUF5684 domain-containing protein [Haliangium sp.]|uniref:DUF5684 domain-containing protein n=1 Tax=Haliangium sp. TaxID=2663208 RepID=UPI003D0B2B7C
MEEGPGIIGLIVQLAICVFLIASIWKVFAKAGKPGWAAIVPIYNLVVMLEIAGKPIWWIVLFFIPIANIIVAILIAIGIAERFGKSTGFGIGLALLGIIFYPILGFGSAQYQGPRLS